MSIRIVTLISLLFYGSLIASSTIMADETASFDIAEFHQILESINKANIPDNVKDRLFQDLKTSMIENVRISNIPEENKRTLIKDLKSSSR
ncbi:hypothetical protein MNBD_GAMMA21-3041 [hydrothermal vent metagenome]|uniref:Uncharacterized protein n=1 Tax=hydrothermal vent metagenome TaxID=652676 RepID=A0A3B1A1N7_9ZZZZ